ncbi:MAG: dockerin type I repeat-containing protein [Muribaculaceae bacterium]|nr:dockerin type I repeat-containing protein [Muribaculaceae bacterium]
MKKSVLLLLLAVMASAIGAKAVTDGQTYAEVNGIKIVNQWIFDRVHSGTDYTSNAICNQRARTATMDQGIIYVARSEELAVIIGSDTISQSVIHRFSAVDGSPLEDLPLTLDGAPYGRFLGVASIGKDSFHHIWVAPMTSNVQQYVPVYLVNTETGELTLVVELDKGDAPQRTDYLDVIGDLTLEQAECNIMTVSGSTADPGFPTLYRMHADQGGDWEGGFDGDPYMDVINFYPETKTGFSLAPVIKMIEGPDEDSRYSGEMFYIDCFDTAPVIYDFSGSVIDSFEEVDPELWPKSAPNGCIEFHLEGRDFLTYVIADMNGGGYGCQANICELGEGQSLGGMTKYWQIPADSLGKVNDSGLRVHSFAVEYGVDDEGYEEVTLFTFKAYNGMAVYKIGRNVDAGEQPQPGIKGDVNGDGEVNIADVNAIIDCILTGTVNPRGDVNGDTEVNIADVNAVIDIILNS